MKSPPKLSSPHECLNMLVITFIRSHMTASICSCLARPQYFIIPSPLTPLSHNGCVLANWIIMTQNRPCSDSLPAQAIHNGFSNTTGPVMAQLVNFKYGRKEEANEGGVVTQIGTWKQKKRQMRKRQKGRIRKERSKTESKEGTCVKKRKEQRSKERKRNPRVHILYAIQESHNTAGQQLWPWWFWQKWFTMVTVGLQPSEHPRTPHHSPTFLAASLPIWLDAQLKCHASATHMHTRQINRTEAAQWKEQGASHKSKWEKPETKVTH